MSYFKYLALNKNPSKELKKRVRFSSKIDICNFESETIESTHENGSQNLSNNNLEIIIANHIDSVLVDLYFLDNIRDERYFDCLNNTMKELSCIFKQKYIDLDIDKRINIKEPLLQLEKKLQALDTENFHESINLKEILLSQIQFLKLDTSIKSYVKSKQQKDMLSLITSIDELKIVFNKSDFLITNKNILFDEYDLEKIKQSLTYLKNITLIEADFELPKSLTEPLNNLDNLLESLIGRFYCSFF